MKIHRFLLGILIPPAVLWMRWHERRILRSGRHLSRQELLDADAMGVAEPEKIRILEVSRIPLFNGWFITSLSRVFPMISSRTVGLSLRHGIYVRSPHGDDRRLIAHECVHSEQYERAGSIAGFLMEYFSGCIEMGYPDAPLEREAIERSSDLDNPM